MAIYKRFKGKKVTRRVDGVVYDRAIWQCEGMVDGERYKKSLPNAKTKSDAEAEEDLIIAKIRHNEFAFLKDKTRFCDFVEKRYLPYSKLHNPSQGAKAAEIKNLNKIFADKLLRSITPALIESYKQVRMRETVHCQLCERAVTHCSVCRQKETPCAKCRGKNAHDRQSCEKRQISPSTVNRELTTLSKIMSRAVIERIIKDNPCQLVEHLPEPEPRDRLLSPLERIKLIAAVSPNPQLLALVVIALSTGWRRGQILNIRLEDLDAEFQAVSLQKSKQQRAKKVPVNDLAWNVLQSLAEKVKSGYLFVNEKTGKQQLSFAKSWKTALGAAGIEGFHFHDLRACFASQLLMQGVDLASVSKALGHSQIQTTGIYARNSFEGMRDNLNKIDEKFLM